MSQLIIKNVKYNELNTQQWISVLPSRLSLSPAPRFLSCSLYESFWCFSKKIHIFKLISFNYYANVISFCAFLLPRGDSLVLSEMSECDSGWDSVLLCLCCQSLKQYSLSVTDSQWSLVKSDDNFIWFVRYRINTFVFFLFHNFILSTKPHRHIFSTIISKQTIIQGVQNY